jgi:hypothetical protein
MTVTKKARRGTTSRSVTHSAGADRKRTVHSALAERLSPFNPSSQ